jgi:hypothetical protein
MNHSEIATDLVGAMTAEERLPVLCEIIRKTETLQVRAVAVIYGDREYEKTHGSWTAFCRSEFEWDDSYASRMRKAAEMVLDGISITNESQARALSSVEPEKREGVLEKARRSVGGEPSASQISMADSDDERDEAGPDQIKRDQAEIDSIVRDLRAVLKRVKDLPKNGSGMWVNMPHLIADMKNAAEALKHARPHGPCDEWGTSHDENCLCGGTGWLPKHVLERPKGGDNA